jgi:DNA mismatch endonuclease (patch repair protein)
MSRIRSKNTQVELRIRKALHRKGWRYRVHPPRVPGKPDVVFSSRKVAIFIDGDFWHGWKFTEWRDKLAPYWRTKIEKNMQRDEVTRSLLEAEGWLVVRIWEHEIKKDLASCVSHVEEILLGRSPTSNNRKSGVRK